MSSFLRACDAPVRGVHSWRHTRVTDEAAGAPTAAAPRTPESSSLTPLFPRDLLQYHESGKVQGKRKGSCHQRGVFYLETAFI